MKMNGKSMKIGPGPVALAVWTKGERGGGGFTFEASPAKVNRGFTFGAFQAKVQGGGVHLWGLASAGAEPSQDSIENPCKIIEKP